MGWSQMSAQALLKRNQINLIPIWQNCEGRTFCYHLEQNKISNSIFRHWNIFLDPDILNVKFRIKKYCHFMRSVACFESSLTRCHFFSFNNAWAKISEATYLILIFNFDTNLIDLQFWKNCFKFETEDNL